MNARNLEALTKIGAKPKPGEAEDTERRRHRRNRGSWWAPAQRPTTQHQEQSDARLEPEEPWRHNDVERAVVLIYRQAPAEVAATAQGALLGAYRFDPSGTEPHPHVGKVSHRPQDLIAVATSGKAVRQAENRRRRGLPPATSSIRRPLRCIQRNSAAAVAACWPETSRLGPRRSRAQHWQVQGILAVRQGSATLHASSGWSTDHHEARSTSRSSVGHHL